MHLLPMPSRPSRLHISPRDGAFQRCQVRCKRALLQAKWGEKSEQWIVNDLGKDGSNVNGWHWQEQNKLPWSKQRIDELVKGLSTQLDASIGSAEVDGVKDVTGEV